MDITEKLTYFNLTRQEAVLYAALLTEPSLTGYEAAKLTGISRSNTYTGLAGLVEKGAAYVLEEKATRYTAVPADEFCQNRIARLKQLKEEVLNELPQLKTPVEGYVTIKGTTEIYNKMRNTINKARERIYISAASVIVNELKNELAAALKRGLKVVIISGSAVKLKGAIIYASEKADSQIRLIADSHEVLTGDLAEGESSTCLYSCKRNLVDLFKEALKNEIKLIELQPKIKK